jgi:hypothetical protein
MCGFVFSVSESFVFTGANTERSTVVINLNHSFFIVRLRSDEIHRTVANIVHDTVVRARSKQPNLDHMVEGVQIQNIITTVPKFKEPGSIFSRDGRAI